VGTEVLPTTIKDGDMPNWKKVIVSGSNVSQLNNDGVYLRTIGDGVISSSAQLATQISGAFTVTSSSLSDRISSLSSSSTTFAGTGSNTFKGDQTFSGSLLPETTEVFSLGSPDKVWESLYVDGQSIYMKDVATNTFVTMSANAGVLTFNNTRLNVPLGITSSNLILTSIVNAGTDTDKFLVLDTNGNVDFRTGTEILSDIGGQGLSAGTVSSSAQIQAYDIFLEKLGDNVISSSQQIKDYNVFATTGSNTFIGTQSITGSLSANGGITGSFKGNLDGVANFGQTIAVSSVGTTTDTTLYPTFTLSPIIGSYTSLYSHPSGSFFYNGVTRIVHAEGFSGSIYATNGVISSSAQLTTEFDTRYLNTSGDGVISSSAQIATDISGAFTATSGGLSTRITTLEGAGGTTFSSSVSTRLTSVEGYTLDNVTDNGSSTTNVITVGGLTVNGNATITGTLTAQQFNTELISSSIIFESGSTKFGDSIDDIHSFTGSVKLNTQTAATTDTDKFLVFDTGGEIKYRTGAEVLSDINPGGLVSSSAQLTTEFDTRYLNTTGDSVISSSAQLTTEFDTRYLNTTGDSVISSSAQLTTEFDTRYLNTTGDGVISSSAQVTISSTTGYTTFSSSIASDIAALSGAGYVDVGTAASASRLAVWQDGNTIRGYENITIYDGNQLDAAGLYLSGGSSGIGRKVLHGSGGGTSPSGQFSILKCGNPADSLGAHVSFTVHVYGNRNAGFKAGTILAVWDTSGGNIQYYETSTSTYGTLPTHQVYPVLAGGFVYIVLENNSGISLYVTANADIMTTI
jgi:hypothetical protein